MCAYCFHTPRRTRRNMRGVISELVASPLTKSVVPHEQRRASDLHARVPARRYDIGVAQREGERRGRPKRRPLRVRRCVLKRAGRCHVAAHCIFHTISCVVYLASAHRCSRLDGHRRSAIPALSNGRVVRLFIEAEKTQRRRRVTNQDVRDACGACL